MAAAEAGLEVAAGALPREPDMAAVRLGLAVAAGCAASRATPDGGIDVPTLWGGSRRVGADCRAGRRRRVATILWGRLGELMPSFRERAVAIR